MQVPGPIERKLNLIVQKGSAQRGKRRIRRKTPRPPLESKPYLRLAQFELARGIEPTRIDEPQVERPLESLRAAVPAMAAGEVVEEGSDSPYLEAYRQLAQMQQLDAGAGVELAPAALVQEAWRPIGPFSIPHGQTYGGGVDPRPSVSGRISSVAIDPADPMHILIGSAAGGVWESRDTGATWTPRTDLQPSLTTGAIAFDPSSSQTVYAGTGEGDSFSWLGAGLLRSTDGGATWNVRASAPFVGAGFYDIVVDPANGQHLFAATTAGLFESNNGGSTWTTRRAQRTWDLSLAPAAGGQPAEILAGCADGVQVSTDGGATWTAIALTGAPAQWRRIEVCHAPSDTRVAYIVAVGRGPLATDPWLGFIWRRMAGSGNFDPVTFPTDVGVGQASYDWCADVDPTNPDTLYVGGINLVRGDRSGNNWTWTNLSAKTVGDRIHPDQHHITFSPADSNVVYAGCDGGIYRSPDRGVTWRALNKGLCITEFEYLASHPAYDAWLIGGTQDNGTERYEGGEVWLHVQDGDGGDCAIDPATPATCYHTFYGMGIERSTTGGSWGSWAWVGPNVANTYRRLFYPPMEAGSGLLCEAGQSVFISANTGNTWTELALPVNEIASAIVIASAAQVYVGTIFGNIYRIDAVAGVWQNPTLLTQPRAGWVSDLVVDPTNPMRLWASYSTISGGHVYRSDNGGTVWTNVSAGLPTIAFNALVLDPAAPNTVYAAADVGVYRSTDAGVTWTAFSNGLPNCIAGDLVFHQAERLLRVGTRSRGVWEINVDRANMPDVEVYVRDSTVDTGRRAPSPSGADPFAIPAHTYWWESTDIKVDSPPFQLPNLGDVDFVLFEDDHGVQASGLVHENTERNRTVRVYVQVHNRGPQVATNVEVKVFFANASLGLPDLPAGFWTNFPNNVLGATSPWQPIAAHQTIPQIQCGRPVVIGFQWTVPAGQAAHSCLLAVTSAQNDSIATAELNVGNLVLGQQKCALKNLLVIDPVSAPIAPFPIEVWPPRGRGRYSIGADKRNRALKGVVLSERLARYAGEGRLRRRKATPEERRQLQKSVRENRHLAKVKFDLESIYTPALGPWLTLPPGERGQADHLIVLLGKPQAERFALVQWDEQGFPVGGFTFDVRPKGGLKGSRTAGAQKRKKARSGTSSKSRGAAKRRSK